MFLQNKKAEFPFSEVNLGHKCCRLSEMLFYKYQFLLELDLLKYPACELEEVYLKLIKS